MANSRPMGRTFEAAGRLLSRLLCSIVFIMMLSACTAGEDDKRPISGLLETKTGRQTNNGGHITIVDGNGTAMAVRQPVERIVVEYMDNAELVRILGCADRIVGVSGFDYVFSQCHRQFPGLKIKPSVGHPWAMDYEAVLALEPDLLLTFPSDVSAKKANLPGVDVVFLGLYFPDLLALENSRFFKGVETLGRILGTEDRARAYIDWQRALIEKIRSRTVWIDPAHKPKVLISAYPDCSSSGSTYCAYSLSETMSQACLLAGGNSIAAALPDIAATAPSVPVDTEWLYVQDPDIIILHAVDRKDECGYETDDITLVKQGIGQILQRREMAKIKAAKNKKVFMFDGHFRNDASGGTIAAVYMAKIFYPELFADLNPEVVHQEYLAMQGLDYDLDQHGVFIYPPLECEQGLMGIPDYYKGEVF